MDGGSGGRLEWEVATQEVTESELSGKPWEKLEGNGVGVTERTNIEGMSVRQARTTSSEAAVKLTVKGGRAQKPGQDAGLQMTFPRKEPGLTGPRRFKGKSKMRCERPPVPRLKKCLTTVGDNGEEAHDQPEGHQLANAGDILASNKNGGHGLQHIKCEKGRTNPYSSQ